MRIVCYAVDIGVSVPNGGVSLEQMIFFGEESEVLKDLEQTEKIQNQVLITHPSDPVITPMARIKLQVVGQLKNHDTTKIPQFPAFGTGQLQMLDPEFQIKFQIMLRVSYRGEVAKADITKPVNILLPPGVRT